MLGDLGRVNFFSNRVQDQRIDGWVDHRSESKPEDRMASSIAEGGIAWPEATGFLSTMSLRSSARAWW